MDTNLLILNCTYFVINEFCNNSETTALLDGSGSKHLTKNNFKSLDNTSGMSGCSLKVPTLKIAASGGPNYSVIVINRENKVSLTSKKGGFPVTISITVQPNDHTSACNIIQKALCVVANLNIINIKILLPITHFDMPDMHVYKLKPPWLIINKLIFPLYSINFCTCFLRLWLTVNKKKGQLVTTR